ncbi:NucA/NucB deoxyribonuclease domain-containing protein [Streptomyces ossamyceticus]|nr:NucA/NucB deoxyribonuclease domain-containing protein [Streptomyces ossamyceticus]
MKRAVVSFALAASLAMVGSGESAVADQQNLGSMRGAVSPNVQRASKLVSTSPTAAAVCTKNQISINRFSECEWLTLHFDIYKTVGGKPSLQGTVDFDVKHKMTLKAKSINWSEKFELSKAKTTGAGKGSRVKIAVASQSGTKAKVTFDQGRTLDSASSGSVSYTTGAIAKKKINASAKTKYTFTVSKPGYRPGTVSYQSAAYRCDNYYGTSGCAFPEAPTAVSMINQARIAEGIRKLRARGGHYGDPEGGKPLHWMINDTQKDKNRAAVCPKSAPDAEKKAGRTSCDEYPFASTREGGTKLPAAQRTITWVKKAENDSQGATITNWRRAFHVMNNDPFYVIA